MSKAEAWFPLPIRLVDEMMPRLKDTEIRVLIVILRQTTGRQANPVNTVLNQPTRRSPTKQRDWLSHSQLCRRTGRASEAVSAAVASLIASDLIVVEDAAGTTLATADERRRCVSRLYFRPGQELILPVEKWKTRDFSHPGKPKTTTY